MNVQKFSTLRAELEMEQRHAARYVFNDYGLKSSVTPMLQQLGWVSGQFPPGQFPRTVAPHQFPPRSISPWIIPPLVNSPPGLFPPRSIAPQENCPLDSCPPCLFPPRTIPPLNPSFFVQTRNKNNIVCMLKIYTLTNEVSTTYHISQCKPFSTLLICT